MPKYLVPIDLNRNEIQNAVFQKLATAPANPIKGLVYFNTTDNTLYVYDGSEWKDALAESGASDYNDLLNQPIINISENTVITEDGIYRITDNGITVSINGKSITGKNRLFIRQNGVATVFGPNIYKITTSSNEFYTKIDNSKVGTFTKLIIDANGQITGQQLSASDIPDLSGTYIKTTQKGTANGVASLDSNGLVPSSQLPSYVDDVIEVAGINTVTSPETGKIYVDTTDNKSYRWSGTAWINIANPIDIATKADAETGTNNSKMMTPLRTKEAIENYMSQNGQQEYITTIGDGTNTSFTVTHNLHSDVITRVSETSTGEEVITNITYTNYDTLEVSFAEPPTTNQYTVFVLGGAHRSSGGTN